MNRPPTHDRDDSQERAPRRPPRTVSSMTTDQLTRKRALDRIAQRATRARARQHVQRLEREVQELRAKSALEPGPVDSNAVQELYLRNQALTEELRRLQRLAADGGGSPARQAGEAEASLAASPFPLPYTTGAQPQPTHPCQCFKCVENAALSLSSSAPAGGFTLPVSTPTASLSLSASAPASALTLSASAPTTGSSSLLPYSYPVPADQQPDWLAPGLWNDSQVAFEPAAPMPVLGAACQPQTNSHACCTCPPRLSPRSQPTNTAEQARDSSRANSVELQQVALPPNWDSLGSGSNIQWP
ncbi:hypothetical protein QQS21_000297 [Conoideocrella luteorostrata]|uniref:BZIP domain-containing protein n=1 Tax=Conoideocrella luteorostrata TaxID=1105319 RepID=A0AAJ0FZA1_9HYPO|nr:hypothetical protein QQS21_000297 [Conoideocrella luteorostrata]